MRLNNRQTGFAMVEVMVTVIIITIGISGMGMLLMRATQGNLDSSQQSQAMWIVQDYIGRMRANPDGARARRYVLNPKDISCLPTAKPANMCAQTSTGSTFKGADICNSAQMATFDNWISTCGLSGTIHDSPSDFIANPKLTSTCKPAAGNCTQYEVTLEWDTKLTTVSSDAKKRTYKNNYSMIVEFN